MKNRALIEELRKNSLCNEYWDKEIEIALTKEIVLEYEPVGTMGVYRCCFDFLLPYHGTNPALLGTEASLEVNITSSEKEYNLKKALAGKDCFHNIIIKVRKDGKKILSSEFRLWDEGEELLSGKKSIIEAIL